MRKIYGIKKVDYVSKKTGNRVLGTELHCIYEDKNVEGLACELVWINKDVQIPENMIVGSTVEFYYDKYRNVVSINVVE